MLTPDFDFEKSLIPSDTRFLLGIDEVGRGPLAGPLVVAGFLLDLSVFDPAEFRILKVRDSKLLSSSQRQKIIHHIEHNNYSYHLTFTESTDIDRQGISASLTSAFTQILDFFTGRFDFCLIDGNPINLITEGDNVFFHPQSCERSDTREDEKKSLSTSRCKFVVKGDAHCFSIAAASIIAKVARDALMDRYDVPYPQYGFKNHKGYGTAAHLAALKQFGPCPIHRLSFAPLRNQSR